MVKSIDLKNIRKTIPDLYAGDEILLSGKVYTARDAAHKKIITAINNKTKLPFELLDSVIYYAGPTPAKPGRVIGSCGPTTSSRMDIFTPALLELGVAATIGKGMRSDEVIKSIIKNISVYFCAVGGLGALASEHIIRSEVIAYDELGCESVKLLELDNFTVYVGIDCKGNTIFK